LAQAAGRPFRAATAQVWVPPVQEGWIRRQAHWEKEAVAGLGLEQVVANLVRATLAKAPALRALTDRASVAQAADRGQVQHAMAETRLRAIGNLGLV
jgi:hypothetical protein